MDIAPVSPLTCPHDGAPLVRRNNTLVCPHKHSFDCAREGYVNLLVVQDKASLDPGDSREMVAARQRFLATGAYAPIAAAVCASVLALLQDHGDKRSYSVLDAGCGEGYYLGALATALAAHARDTTVHLAGIDISKWAVKAAAKRALPVAWVVASNRRPPFAPACIDLILCLFGFPIWPGFTAVQPAGAHVLLVDPGPDHLLELRRIIYPEVRIAERAPTAAVDGYSLVSEQRVLASAELHSPAVIADLLSMTPHAHRASVEGRVALVARTELAITIDVKLRVFRRTAT